MHCVSRSVVALAAISALAGWPRLAAEEKAKPAAAKSIHDFKVKDTDGKELDLASLKGKVVLLVNVASL
jgi:cytochrome oxidase Cu insertion factor (SCO1/SenC/PrrC family)